MKHSRYKSHYIPLWKSQIYFCETTDCDELIKKFHLKLPKSFEFKNYDGFAWKGEILSGGEDYYLVVRPGVKDAVLVHECVHLAMYILTDRGVTTEVGNDEPFAYLIEYLFEQIKSFINEKVLEKMKQ